MNMNTFKEFFSFINEKRETQEEMLGAFYLRTTVTHCTHSVSKIMLKFVFMEVAETQTLYC